MAFKIVRERIAFRIEDPRGVTLVEMMVALVLLGIISAFVQVVFVEQHRSYTIQEDVSEAQQDIRISLDVLVRDIRAAGYGIPMGSATTAIGLATDADDEAFPNDPNPDSITINVANGPTTYLTAPPGGGVLQVDNASGFAIGETLNILFLQNLNQVLPGGFIIDDIDDVSVPNTLTLTTTPGGGGAGDLVVSSVGNITYCLLPDPAATGTFILVRAIGVPCADPIDFEEALASHIRDLQFSYIMDNGAEVNTVAAVNLNNVRLVRITLVSQTTREVARMSDSQQRTRQLSTLVMVKNLMS